MTAVTTRGYDNYRTGTIQEYILTSAVVAKKGVKRLFSLPVTGDARGCESQPLYVPNLTMSDGCIHNVVYLCSMSNQIWAYDADTGILLWQQRIANPIKGSRTIDGYVINDNWGILSTPVIDLDAGALYCVGWSSPDGTTAQTYHSLYMISLINGSMLKPSLSLQGAKYDPGHKLPVRSFSSVARKQRTGLLLTSQLDSSGNKIKTVFVGAGSINEDVDNLGWIIACDVVNWKIATAWAAAGRGQGGGIWQAGAGLCADDNGNIYVMTGNGDFDGITDFGNCFMRLVYTPSVKSAPASLIAADWWSPWTDHQRTGGAVAGEVGYQTVPDEGNTVNPIPTNIRVYDVKPMQMGDWGDMDLGSGGPVLVPSHNVILGAGKDGIAYILKMNNMGKTLLADLDQPKNNYAKILQSLWFTYYPGYNNSQPDDPQKLNFFGGGKTHHQHGSPVVVVAPLDTHVFCWGENGTLRAWSLGPDNLLYYIGEGDVIASAQSTGVGGMPGAMMCAGANGNDGVLWATVPYDDANKMITPGRLVAYDIRNYDSIPGSTYKRLRKIWDSQDWGISFSYNKFNPPMIINGKVYVPTYSGTVDVYG